MNCSRRHYYATPRIIIAMQTFRFFYRLATSTLFFLLLVKPVFNIPKNLSLPKSLEVCTGRKLHYNFKGSGYYVSWLERDTRNLFINWLDARNWCRERCMDLISLENPEEIAFVRNLMQKYKIEYCWTSARLCDFDGCENRKDLQPLSEKGWFWSATGRKMRPTNEKSQYNDWSHTGGLRKPQPDNREKTLVGGYTESCMAVINNLYNDGIRWHDVACHHIKSFICEDSKELLDYAKRISKQTKS